MNRNKVTDYKQFESQETLEHNKVQKSDKNAYQHEEVFGEEEENYWNLQQYQMQPQNRINHNSQIEIQPQFQEKFNDKTEDNIYIDYLPQPENGPYKFSNGGKITPIDSEGEEKINQFERQKLIQQRQKDVKQLLQQSIQKKIVKDQANKKEQLESFMISHNNLSAKDLGHFKDEELDMEKSKAKLMQDIFERIKQCPEVQAITLSGKEKVQFCLNFKNNAIYWDPIKKNLIQQNIYKNEKEIIRESIQQFPDRAVTRIKISTDEDYPYLFIGFSNGQVVIVEDQKTKFQFLAKHQPVFQGNGHNIDSPVCDIFAQKYTFAVTHKNGSIEIFKRNRQNNSNAKNALIVDDKKYYQRFQEKSTDYPIEQLKISKNGKFLVGVQKYHGKHVMKQNEPVNNEDEQQEIILQKYLQQIVVYNLVDKQIEKNKFEFEKILAEIKNCYILTQIDDITTLFAISELNGGLTKFQLVGDQVEMIDQVDNMHTGYIIDQTLFDDKQTLVTVGNDKLLKVWDINALRVIKDLPVTPQNYQYTSIYLSKDQRYLVTEGKDKIAIWFVENWFQICTIKIKPDENNQNPSSIQLSNDNTILYQVNSDGDIVYWKIQEPTESIRINFGEVNITQALTTPDNHYLLTQDDKGFTYLWNIYNRNKEQTLCENQKLAQIFNCTKDSRYVFLKSEDNVIQQWNLKQSEEQQLYSVRDEISSVKIKEIEQKLYMLVLDVMHRLTIFELGTDKSYKINIPLKENIENENFYPDLCVSIFDNLCVATSCDKSYHIIDIEYPQRAIVKESIPHSANINSLVLDRFDRLLIIIDDQKFSLINFQTRQPIKLEKDILFEQEENFKAYFDLYKNQFYTYNRKQWQYYYYDIDLQEGYKQVDFEGEHQEIIGHNKELRSILDEEKEIRQWNDSLIITLSGQNYLQKNEFANQSDWRHQNTNIKGPMNLIFPQIIKQMSKDIYKMIEYIPALKQNTIEPFRINLMHYLAYQNQNEELDKCFKIGMKFKSDKFSFTPLKYALIKKSMKSIEVILNNATRNEDIFPSIKDQEICTLIIRSPSNLVEFLESACIEIQENKLIFNVLQYEPQFFDKPRIITDKEKEFQRQIETINQQKISCFKKPVSDQNEADQDKEKNDVSIDAQPIMLKAFNFKYNFIPGSQDSINFHWALSLSKTTEVFQATPIQKLIDYKWQKLRLIGQVQFLIMIIHNCIILLHQYYLENLAILIVLTIFCFYFFIFEIISVANKNILVNLNDVWFWLDVTFLLVTVSYLVYEFFYYQQYGQKNWILAIVNFLSWGRTFSQLRAFQQTRIFIHIIKTVLKKLIDFLIIVIFAVITSSTTFIFLQYGQVVWEPEILAKKTQTDINNLAQQDYNAYFEEKSNLYGYDFVNRFYKVYEFLFASFDEFFQLNTFQSDTPELLNWFVVLFVLSEFIISLIMMNLLIAIVVDTHDDLMTNISFEDYSQMNQLILKYENMLFWRKNYKKASYLHWYDYSSNQSQQYKSSSDHIVQAVSQPQKIFLNKINWLLSESQAEKNKTQILEKQIFKISFKTQGANSGELFKKEFQNIRTNYLQEFQNMAKNLRNEILNNQRV